MNDELNKLYTALIGKGYTTDDLGDENTFRSMMSDKNNRKDLYDYVSERGDFRIGDYDAYEQRLTSQPIDKSQYTFTGEQLGLEDNAFEGLKGMAESQGVTMPVDSTLPTENRNQDIFAGREAMARYADSAQNLRKAQAAYNMSPTAENAEQLDSAAMDFSNVETSRLNAEKEKRTKEELLAERKRLEDAKKEVELRLRTRRGEIASPSGMYQMGMAPVTGNQAAEITDPEMTKLYAAVNSYDNAIRSVDRKLSGEDPGFWEGVADATVRNPGFYTMGLTDMSDARGMLNIAQNGVKEKEDELLADALYSKNAEQQDEDFGFLYGAGNMFGHSVPFLVQTAVTGGFSGASRAGANLAGRLGKKAAEGTIKKKIINAMGTTIDDVIEAGLIANTAGAGGTWANIAERKAGKINIKDGDYVFENGESWLGALYKGEVSSILELYTEKLGGHLEGKLSLTKGLDKIGASRVSNVLLAAKNSDLYKGASTVMRQFGLNGYLPEVLEEEANLVLNSLLVGDNSLSELYNPKTQLDIFGGMLLTVGTMQAIPGTIATAGYVKNQYQMNRADSRAADVFGEDWGVIKEALDNATNEKVAGIVAENLRDNVNQNEALLDYYKRMMIMRGYNIGTVKNETAPEIEEAYTDGFSQEPTGANALNAMTGYDMARQEVARALGLAEGDDVDVFLNGRTAEDIAKGDTDVENAVRNYQQQKARMEGIQEKFQQTREQQYEESDRSIQANDNNGMVYATQLKDEPVFITGGNVVLNEDGTIDVDNSSETLYVKFPDGHVEMTSPDKFTEVFTSDRTADLKAAKRAEIDAKWKAEFDTAEAQSVEREKREAGVVFNMTDAQGEHRIEILNEGEKMSNILFDGAETEISTDELNQWKQEAGIQSADAVVDNTTDNVAPTGDNMAPVAPVELPDVPDFFRLNGTNYEVASRNDDGSVDVMVNGKRETLPAGGTPVVGQRNEGGAVSDDVQGGSQNGVAQEEVPVNEPVGNSEQLSSSEIPNNQPVAEGDAPGQNGVQEITNDERAENGGERMYSQEELAETKELLGELNATSAPNFAVRLFSIRPWGALEEANAALKELLASYGETLNGQTTAVIPFLDEAQRLISENSKNQETFFLETLLDNGDKKITGVNSRGEVATVTIERDGKVVSVDSYDEGVLFEHTEYDGNGKATAVTRYDKQGNVVGTQVYEDGKAKPPMQRLADQVLARAEEKRRIPLRERARELEAQVGVKANIIESVDEVADPEARRRIVAGQNVAGWYSKGEVYLYMPNLQDRREIELTYVHEVVAHHGVKKLLGERFNEFLDGVWNMMSEADRARMLAYVGANENPTLQDMRAAADEYVAELAEKMDLGELEQSTWEKIVDWFKELLENIGFENLTKEDIESMLKVSYSNLKAESGKGKTGSTENDFRAKMTFHGSGAKFDRFDHAFMGTGEGAQAFGWGTYVTEVEGIGKQYANATSKPNLTYKGQEVDVEGYENPWRLINDLYEDTRGKLSEMRAKAERYEGLAEEDSLMKPVWKEVVKILKEARRGDLKASPRRVLYTVEIPDDNGSNYLHWEEVVPSNVVNAVKQRLFDELAKGDYKGAEKELKRELDDVFKYSDNEGYSLYGNISAYLGGGKAASRFLNEMGFVGISYPADGGRAGNKKNYVIFNENDAQIKDRTMFRISRTPQEFDATQAEAVEKRGIVAPGLNEAVVNVVDVPRHDFTGNLKEARAKAKEWAIENYTGKEFDLPENAGKYVISKNAIGKYLDKSAFDKSENAAVHLSVLKELPNVISNSIEAEIHADYSKGDNGERSAENGVNRNDLLVHRIYGAVNIDGKTYRVKTTIHEFRDANTANTPHSYEVTKIELIEDSTVTPNGIDSHLNRPINSISATKLLEGVEKSYDKGKKVLEESENSSENPQDSESGIRFRKVTDPSKIAELEAGEKMKVYRAMQVIDGKLYPPMSAKVDGKLREPIELGVWEEAEERPELADDKGYFKLDKGNKKSLKARYNPYIHTSTTPLNDQFSEAQERPNLVTVEVEIPVSELTSGYKAEKAKDAVGRLEWKAGVVQGKLSGTRTVILSRWNKPVRIVPDSEVADVIVEMFGDREIVMPSNVVTPSLRAELEKRGVPFVETNNQGKPVSAKPMTKEEARQMVRELVVPFAKELREEQERAQATEDSGTRFRITPEMDAEYMAAVENGDMETAERMVKEAAKMAMPDTKIVDENGYPTVVYHRTPNEFTIFDPKKIGESTDAGAFGSGFYLSPADFGPLYGKNLMPLFVNLKNPLMLNDANAFETKEPFYGEDYLWGKEQAENFNAWVKENGYDGVWYENNGRDEIVAFEPNQIKSADAVTYDDKGNVIPLSERFNEEKEDIRFRITDTDRQALEFKRQHKGSANIVAIDTDALVAELLAQGITADEIQDIREKYEKGALGFYDRKRNTIYLLGKDHSKKENDATFWHENTHKVIQDLDIPQEVMDEFYAIPSKRFIEFFEKKAKEFYGPEEYTEELIAYFVEDVQSNGNYDNVTKALGTSAEGMERLKEIVEPIINYINHGRRVNEGAEGNNRTVVRETLRDINAEAGQERARTEAEGAGETRFRTVEDVIEQQQENEVSLAREAATSLGEKLNTPVKIMDNLDSAPENRRKWKGWFDPKTGEVVVVMPNHVSTEDAVQTVLHEVVGHKGLRAVLGEDFDVFLDGVYKNASPKVKRGINDKFLNALRNGPALTVREATEEYIAELAERDFEGYRDTWNAIRQWFRNFFRNFMNMEITDGELRYLLWKNYNRMKSGPVEAILDRAMEANTGTGKVMARTAETYSAVDAYNKSVKGFKNKVKEGWYDEMRSLKKAQEAIEKELGKELMDSENVYLYANHIPSINKNKKEVFDNKYLRPFTSLLEQLYGKEVNGKKLDEKSLERYTNAKHGIERNREMSVKNALTEVQDGKKVFNEKAYKSWAQERDEVRGKNLPWAEEQRELDKVAEKYGAKIRDYSGLTAIFDTEKKLRYKKIADAAYQYVADVEKALGDDVNKLWGLLKGMTDYSLNEAFESGMMSKSTYEHIKQMYRYYVPLRGFTEQTAEDFFDYVEGDHSPLNAVVKTAYGRKSEADNIFATILNMANSAIVQGSKNRLKQRLLNLAMRSQTGLLNVDNAWYAKNGDIYKPVEYPENANEYADFEERMKELEKNGEVLRHRPGLEIGRKVAQTWNETQHAVRVKRNGREYVVWVNGEPAMANAINGLLREEIGGAIKTVNQFRSKMVTQYSPTFVFTNLLRDVQSASIIYAVRRGTTMFSKFKKNVASNATDMMDLYLKHKRGTLDVNNPKERYFKEFLENGGETGYTEMISIEEYEKKLKELTTGLNIKNGTQRAFEAVGGAVDFANRCIENLCRFSAYQTSREAGISILKSIEDAKEVSVNFNRKGSGAMGQKYAKALFMFLNPAVQSIAQRILLTKKYPKKMTAVWAGEFILGAAMPVLYSIISAALGDDDDEITGNYYNLSDYRRRSSLCLPLKDGVFHIPLSHESRVLFGLGELCTSFVMGHEKPEDAPIEALNTLAQSLPLNPVEGWMPGKNIIETMTYNFMPDAVKPVAEAVMNRDFAGNTVHNRTDFNEFMPEYMRGKRGTLGAYKKISKYLTSTDGYEKSFLNDTFGALFNPSVMEHLLEGYLGGLYTFGEKALKAGAWAFGNEEYAEFRNIPIASSFYTSLAKYEDKPTESRTRRDWENAFRFYKDEVKGYDDKEKTAKNGLKHGEEGADLVLEQMERNGEVLMVDIFNDGNDRLKELYGASDAARKNRDFKRVEDIDQQIYAEKRDIVERMEQLADDSMIGYTFRRNKIGGPYGERETYGDVRDEKIIDDMQKELKPYKDGHNGTEAYGRSFERHLDLYEDLKDVEDYISDQKRYMKNNPGEADECMNNIREKRAEAIKQINNYRKNL